MKTRELSWEDLEEKFRATQWPNVDRVIAIARGGLVPGAWISGFLKKPLSVLWIRMYADGFHPQKLYRAPRMLRPYVAQRRKERILLVDDLARTGETFRVALEQLKNATSVTTCVVVGEAAISFYPFEECLLFPWDRADEGKHFPESPTTSAKRAA